MEMHAVLRGQLQPEPPSRPVVSHQVLSGGSDYDPHETQFLRYVDEYGRRTGRRDFTVIEIKRLYCQFVGAAV